MTRRRALLALWATAGLLAAPWAIGAALVALRRIPRQPPGSLPAFRIDTPRRTT